MKLVPALLVLEDGSSYRGWTNNFYATSIGEVVFNTGMTGYQEILTDPSYSGQIVTFTYPEIGNTGVNLEDNESCNVTVKGVIAKNISSISSNWRYSENFVSYLKKNKVLFISGIDTRQLTRHIRYFGSMNGGISNEILEPRDLLKKIVDIPKMQGLDLIKKNTTEYVFSWKGNTKDVWNYSISKNLISKKIFKVIVIDFGVKFNILRQLSFYGCSVLVLPATASYDAISRYCPDGIVLSNGPGDPSTANYAIDTVKQLLNSNIPILGICMGHQILSLSVKKETYKLKFGHRGLNHPSGKSQKVEITSQNHGFAVQLNYPNVLRNSNELQITHFNLNDQTLAGISHKNKPVFSVQYHPEASPGPHDSDYLFYYFVCLMKQNLHSNKSK
nr:CarA [Madagascaria erythrocladioides]